MQVHRTAVCGGWASDSSRFPKEWFPPFRPVVTKNSDGDAWSLCGDWEVVVR